MKKIAFGFLTVLMLLGGVILSACGEKNIYLSVSSSEVVIYTNYENSEFNYQRANVSVTLEGSEDGVGLQIESGKDIIKCTSPEKDRQGNYNFTIEEIGEKSGKAQIKVYSIEDPSIYKYVNVTSYTYLTKYQALDLKDEDGRSGLYVIKGASQDLTPSKYFNFLPSEANVVDTIWTFQGGDGQDSGLTTLQYDGDIIAEIVDNKTLVVYDECFYPTITLFASFERQTSIFETVTFQVIDSSSITSFKLGDTTLISQDTTTGDIIYDNFMADLVRNDANNSSVQGQMVISTFDKNIELDVEAYFLNSNGTKSYIENYEDYFKLDVQYLPYNDVTEEMTINFTLDALYDDSSFEMKYGDIHINFVLKYSEYTYSINTSNCDIKLNTYFIPESILVRDGGVSNIGGNTIDLYSQYFSSYGYEINVNVYPDDVALKDSTFKISIDNAHEMVNDEDYFVKIYYKDNPTRQVKFTRVENTDTFVSEAIANGTSLYFTSGNISSKSGLKIDFYASANPYNAIQSIYANLFKISESSIMKVMEIDTETGETEDFNFDQTFYISSSETSLKTKEFNLRIMGMASIAGLELDYEQSRNFSISMEMTDSFEDTEDVNNSYVDIKVTISLTRSNFAQDFKFSLKHKTGLQSEIFNISSFAPIEKAEVVCADGGFTNIYEQEYLEQNFVADIDDGNFTIADSTIVDNSLSSLLISAGSNVAINLDYNSATLNLANNTAGYYFAYLDYEAFASHDQNLGLDGDTLTERFNNLQFTDSLDNLTYLPIFESAFSTLNNTYFSYTNGQFKVSDKEFVVYVMVVFNGYNELHQDLNLVRFFRLESFYPVDSLRSDITDLELYSKESLSVSDENLSYANVNVTLRLDGKLPTYSDLSYFSISLGNGTYCKGEDESGTFKERASLTCVSIYNDYVSLSNFRVDERTGVLSFRISANSTRLQSRVRDVITLYYNFKSVEIPTNINLTILQANRVENVTWINETEDSEIYLNIATDNVEEQTFTISTSISPDDAYNRKLTNYYHPLNNNSSVLDINTTSTGQSFTLTIGNQNEGGYGYLYLLPEDMVKNVDSIRKIVYYGLDDEGNLSTQAEYISLSEINGIYEDLINGTNGYVNYFLNNNNEKVYYKDVILRIKVTIADGQSEDTAIRIYSADELRNIDTRLYYRIMNDLELTNWTQLTELRGMIFGNDENITLTMSGQSLIGNLYGTVKNLTFVGAVNGGGFVADNVISGGVIENVKVDVRYDKEKAECIPSVVSGGYYVETSLIGNYIGAIAGRNEGLITSCYNYGANLTASLENGSSVAGGIVGLNYGRVENCGVEFYKFTSVESNQFSALYIGGIVGAVDWGQEQEVSPTIYNSYVYAFSLENGTVGSDIDINNVSYTKLVNYQESMERPSENGDGNVYFGEFIGYIMNLSQNKTMIENSFAFLGDLTANKNAQTNYSVIGVGDSIESSPLTLRNSYLTNFVVKENAEDGTKTLGLEFRYFLRNGENNINSPITDEQDSESVEEIYSAFDTTIWETENIDKEANFGFAYLKNVRQNVSVSVEQMIQNVEDKVLAFTGGDKAVIFKYDVNEQVVSNAVQSELDRLNTISLTELFGISSNEIRSLLVSVDRPDYLDFTTNSLSVKKTTTNLATKTVTLTLHSRMDFSESKTFEIMIVNAIPEILTTVGNNEVKDGQIVNIQTGIDNSKKVQIILDNTIYLNGQEYTLTTNSYNYFVELDNNLNAENEKYIDEQVSGNAVEFIARNDSGVNYISANISVGLLNLNSTDENSNEYAFNETIKSQRQRNLLLSSYVGANYVNADHTILNITPSEFTSFKVTINSDNPEEDLVLYINYNNERYDVENGQVKINDNLVLDVSYTLISSDNGNYEYKVLINVNNEYRHKVDTTYSMDIVVNALSQQNNSNYAKIVKFTVEKQEINDVNVNAYTVSSRFIRNNVWYYTPSNTISSALVPGGESILTMEISPSFAHYSHFIVEYEVTSQGTTGSVGLSRLSYTEGYGYYIDTSTTENRTNGIKVNPTETDLKTGVYNFRIYISSSFTANSNVKLNITFFDGNDRLETYTYNYIVDYLKEAEVLVDGAHSVMLAKGDTAEVSITLELDQTLYNNTITLENNSASITLSEITETVADSYKVYTSTLRTSVLSTLQDNKSTGAFYVKAAVSRYVNGVQEIKESYATVYLVDFTIDAEKTKVVGSTDTVNYNGVEYDAFNAYINDSKGQIAFDYTIAPENYVYDETNVKEQEAVKNLMIKRNEFIKSNYYADSQAGYYINYRYNELTGVFEEQTLKERLYYVNSDGSATAIWNGQDYIKNTTFDFGEETNGTLGIIGRQTGRVLMRLETIVIVGNTTFVYEYDFVVVVEVWTDEEVPLPIYTAEEFLTYLNGSPDDEGNTHAADYILMNDIVLDEYTPLSSQYFNSFDGNGYTIHINSFEFSTESTSLNLALFSEVAENSTIKNVRVNLYNGGQITVNLNLYTQVNVAGFALENNGIIYNCEVLAYYDEENSTSRLSGDTGLVVKFVRGNGTDPVYLTSSDVNISDVNISGFVNNNNNVITNSRVGGTSIGKIISDDTTDYYINYRLPTFTIQGQCNVSGFVGSNVGTITASFANAVQINNEMRSTTSRTAGFVLNNTGNVQTSYVQGVEVNESLFFEGSTIATTGKVAGFVYSNSGLVKNSYVNIAFEIDASRSYLSAGFVYENNEDGEITLCYSSVKMSNTDINEMSFSGVDELGNDLNLNKDGITYSYYYSESRNDQSTQASYDTGAYAITDVEYEETFYRFSFSSEENAYNGIWMMTNKGITLVSANQIAFSNRYIEYSSEDEYSLFYNTLTDYASYRQIDLSYGSINNPIIIRNADDFAKATGKAQELEISSYKKYYNDREVFGNYRLVNNIDFSEIDQNTDGTDDIKLTTTDKDFKGLIDGNSFTISNINLGGSASVENYGIFKRIVDNAVIMNLGLQVASVHNSNANIVGTLAGTVIDSRLISINLSPMERSDDEEIQAVSIAGYNIVGGLVGLVMGDSKLSDIQVTDIDVDSGYYSASKEVNGNKSYTGVELRNLVEMNSSLTSKVRFVSYAGGIAGYVDIYDSITDSFVRYSPSTQVTSYNIATIRVLNSVDIYGEVAGGLFGYIGESTLAYDLGLEINADMALNTPSYITAKNLYAGGIVGENHGGLYAIYAEHTRELQDLIETNIYNYYNNSSTVERGQMSIFSYTQNDTKHYGRRYNNPYYIGGLVGYAGSGYISVGYNRLNVVSNEAETFTEENKLRTLAVGGLVGYVDSKNYYASDVISGNPDVSYYLNEVYFSGVINANTAVEAGGLIGRISSTSKVAIDYVNSVPYYDLNTDINKVFSFIGGFDSALPSNLYVLDTAGGYNDLMTAGGVSGGTGSVPSVGIMTEYGAVDAETLNVVKPINDNYSLNFDENSYLKIDRIASSSMSTLYTKMNNYFLENGWDITQWEHEVDTLYPRIVLTPKLSVVYLDASENSIRNVMDLIENGSTMTIVVRGRVDENSDAAHTDVDLRDYINASNRFSNYAGKIVSYYSYMNNSTEEGTVSEEQRDNAGKLIGGKTGARVGLIIDQPIFENAGTNFEMEDINIYYARSDYAPNSISSLLINGTANDATFTNVNIYLNESITLEANAQGYAGLIVNRANSTTFSNITINLRNSSTQDIKIKFETYNGNSNQESNYFGLLAGYMSQASQYKGIFVSNVLINSLSSIDKPISTLNVDVDISKGDTTGDGKAIKNLYFGLWAGNASIASGNSVNTFDAMLSNLTTSVIKETNITINSSDNVELSNLYVGGYFGSVGTTSITRYNADADSGVNLSTLVENLNIIQNIGVSNIYAGLVAGTVNSTNFNFEENENQKDLMLGLSGSYRQAKDKKIGNVSVGAIFGQTNANITLGQKVDVNFNVLGNYVTTTQAEVSTLANEDEVKGIYIKNDMALDDNSDIKLDTNNNAQTDYLQVAGIANVGSLIGNMVGGTMRYRAMDIKGEIQIKNSGDDDTNAGVFNVGAIGYLGGGEIRSGETTDSSIIKTNILVNNSSDAFVNVGGFIGGISDATTILSIGNLAYVGNVVSFAKNLVFGGIVGDAGYASSSDLISNAVFGGNLRHYVRSNIDNKTEYTDGILIAGGIVGNINIPKSSVNITEVYTYGNIFVNYPNNSTKYLNKYCFGGIVGAIGALTASSSETTNTVSVTNAYSLLTNFNDKITYNGYTTTDYVANAIVGFGDGSSNLGDNVYYSSGVNLAYQANENANDVSYGVYVEDYRGYTIQNDTIGNTTSETAETPSDETNIVGEIKNMLTTNYNGLIDANDINKLNPTLINNNSFTEDGKGIDNNEELINNANDNDIKWYYANSDISINNGRYITDLKNAVVVGNGRTISYQLIATASNDYGIFQNVGGINDTFTAISGFVAEINLDIELDKEDKTNYIGGFISKSKIKDDNSLYYNSVIIYGIGVTGQIEIGGDGSANVGGLAGVMYNGLISNSFTDVNIIYHGGVQRSETNSVVSYVASSNVSSIANNTGDSMVDIIDTFAGGAVQSYVSANLYSFNGILSVGTTNNGEYTNANPDLRIFDSYTYSQISRVDYEFGTSGISGTFSYKGSYAGKNADEINIHSGLYFNNYNTDTNDANNTIKFTGSSTKIDDISLNYNGEVGSGYAIKLEEREDKENTETGEIEKAEPVTHSLWFNSPYRNYGYATTGFAYLRNVTVYSQARLGGIASDDPDIAQDEDGNRVELAYKTYDYTRLTNDQALGIKKDNGKIYFENDEELEVFFAVPNGGKFKQIADMYNPESEDTTTQTVTEIDAKYNFFLLYDLNLNNLTGDESWTANSDIGTEDYNTYIDGQNHQIEFNGSGNGFFGVAYADLENMRIILSSDLTTANATEEDISVGGNSETVTYEYYGVLAGELIGSATNITVSGNIEVRGDSNRVIGGLVGKLSNGSTVTAIESLVNINVAKSTSGNSGINYVGGVVGFSEGTISTSSNSGNIIVNNTSSSKNLANLTPTDGVISNLTAELPKYDDSLSDLENNTSIEGNEKVSNNLQSVIGGVAGYNGGTIEKSYNTSSVMNNYNATDASVGNLVSGGIAGYSIGDIANSFNTGYVVSGNTSNTGLAISGGIVGFGNSGEYANNINDAKVQAVSELDSGRYKITPLYSFGTNEKITNYSRTVTLRIEYNIDSESEEKDARKVYAYGIGYITNYTSNDFDNNTKMNTNKNLAYDEIVNDGNLGYIKKIFQKDYSVQRYYGADHDNDNRYDVEDSYNFAINNGDPDFKISGYDAYGFVSRLNLNYTYSFDITAFKHGYIVENTSDDYYYKRGTDFFKISITDSEPNEYRDNRAIPSGTIDVNGSTLNDSDTSGLYPGGTTSYYLSMPFYGEEGNYTYQEIISEENNHTYYGVKSDLTSNEYNIVKKELNYKYEEINKSRKVYVNSTEAESININGISYNIVNNETQLSSYTSGWNTNGSITLEIPSVSHGDKTIASSQPKIDYVEYEIKVNYGTDYQTSATLTKNSQNLTPIGSSEEIVNTGNNSYTLNYSVYYNKTDLGNALKTVLGDDYASKDYRLSVSLNYNIEYEFEDSFDLYKNTVTVNGANVSIDVVDDANKLITLGTYLKNSNATKTNGDFDIEFKDARGQRVYINVDGTILDGTDGNYGVQSINVNSAGSGMINLGDASNASAFATAINNLTMTIKYQVYGSGNYVIPVESGRFEIESEISKSYRFTSVESGLNYNDDYSDSYNIEASESKIIFSVYENKLIEHDIVAVSFVYNPLNTGVTFEYNTDSGFVKHTGVIEGWGGTGSVEYVINENTIEFTCVNSGDINTFINSFKSITKLNIEKEKSSLEIEPIITQSVGDGLVTVNYKFDGVLPSGYTYNSQTNVITRNEGTSVNLTLNYVKDGDINIQDASSVTLSSNNDKIVIYYIKNTFEKNIISGNTLNVKIEDSNKVEYEFYRENSDLQTGGLLVSKDYSVTKVISENFPIRIARNVTRQGVGILTYDYEQATIYDVNNSYSIAVLKDGDKEDFYLIYKGTDGSLTNKGIEHFDLRLLYSEYFDSIIQEGEGIFSQKATIKFNYSSPLSQEFVNDGKYSIDGDGNVLYDGNAVTETMLFYDLNDLKFVYYVVYSSGEEEINEALTLNNSFNIDEFLNLGEVSEIPEIFLVADEILNYADNSVDTIIKFNEDYLATIPENITFNLPDYTPVDDSLDSNLYCGEEKVSYNFNIANGTINEIEGELLNDIDNSIKVTENTNQYNFEYIGNGVNDEESLKEKYNGIPYGAQNFDVTFNVNANFNYTSNNLVYNAEDLSGNNIIIKNNIYYDDQISVTGIKLYGENHIISQNLSLSNSSYMFSVDGKGYVSNSYLVAILTMNDSIYMNNQRSAIQVENTSTTKNLSVYGSIRNINPNNDLIVTGLSLKYDSSTATSSSEKNFQSHLSLIGSNIEDSPIISSSKTDGENVKVKIGEVYIDKNTTLEELTLSINTILISGNGGNASNGMDGTGYDYYGNGYSGTDGGKGGNAGEIGITYKLEEKDGKDETTITKPTDLTKAISGVVGASGNGGNGHDGKNASAHNENGWRNGYTQYDSSRGDDAFKFNYSTEVNNGLAGGGGHGGTADTSNKSASSQKTNRKYQTISGNGGSGGLGLMYYSRDIKLGDRFEYTDFEYPDYDYKSLYKATKYNEYSSWYKTAGGGGTSGDYENAASGDKGRFFGAGDGFFRGDSYDASTIGYYWYDGARLFGNLQLISTFSNYGYYDAESANGWYNFWGRPRSAQFIADGGLDMYSGASVEEIKTAFNYFLYGGRVHWKAWTGDGYIEKPSYIESLNRLFQENDNGTYSYKVPSTYSVNYHGECVWKYAFYGGSGGGEGTGESGNGGTPYTKIIYGFCGPIENYDNYSYANRKVFFTRDDMVTSAGSYGQISNLANLIIE